MPNCKTKASCGACGKLIRQLIPKKYRGLEIMLNCDTRKILTLGELALEW